MAELARVEAEQRGSLCVVRLHGEVDMSNAQEISEAMEDAPAKNAAGLVVDLTHTTYLDSAGIALLVRLAERLRARRQQVRLLVPTGSPVRRVLELTGLRHVMPMTATLEDALAAGDGLPGPDR